MPRRNVLVCRSVRVSYMLSSLAANQNEAAVKTLKLGMLLPTLISILCRVLFRRDSLPPSKGSLAIYIATFFPAFFLSNYLIKIGTTRRDPTTGTLISYGEDLNQAGVTEWCFDILYVTCELNCFFFEVWTKIILRGVSNRKWRVWRMVLVAIHGG